MRRAARVEMSLPRQTAASLAQWLETLPKTTHKRRKAESSGIPGATAMTASWKQQRAWINNMISLCTRFPAQHFLRTLAGDLAGRPRFLDN